MRLPSILAVVLLALALCAGCQEDGGAQETSTVETRPSSGLTYVALGDSYSSAPGVPDTDMSNPCLRSTNNYPSMVADELSAGTFVDVTCGGATTQDMTQAQHDGVAPQLDALTRDTNLVTLGIGGNDSSVFFQAVYQCAIIGAEDPTGSPCADNDANTGTDLKATLATTEQSIVGVVKAIKKRSPKAEIVLVGYPQLVPETGTCPALPLAAGDYPWARDVNKLLTDTVESAARATKTEYVDMWAASAGHDACAARPWVNGAANNEFAAAYHPRVQEQQAAADLVVKAFRG